MNKSELVETIDLVIKTLDTNKNILTPPLLTKIEDFLTQYNTDNIRLVISASFGVSEDEVVKWFEAAQKIIDVERNLIGNNKTEKIIDSLYKLKARPVILSLLAGLT